MDLLYLLQIYKRPIVHFGWEVLPSYILSYVLEINGLFMKLNVFFLHLHSQPKSRFTSLRLFTYDPETRGIKTEVPRIGVGSPPTGFQQSQSTKCYAGVWQGPFPTRGGRRSLPTKVTCMPLLVGLGSTLGALG